MDLQSVKRRFGIIGNTATLNSALKTAIQVAPTELTVLITGESGVGKESFSKIIHHLSPRKHGKFIAINCGAIPEGTINSELFGHTKGAFTGATGERKGYFETVNGGTIFLDEIGEMPLDTQAYLLRVLEQGEFIRVGSSAVEKTDVRVVAATNVNLMERVKKGKFREDLYYRLNTVPIRVPPLREREGDIHLLFRKFASDFAERYSTQPVRLDERAQLLLESYSWPGNIRELRNVAEQVSVLAEQKEIDVETLLRFIPDALKRNLPVLREKEAETQDGSYERELIFKFLYDMRKDIGDLKSLIVELVRKNNLSMPSNLPNTERSLPAILSDFKTHEEEAESFFEENPSVFEHKEAPRIIINHQENYTSENHEDQYRDAEEIEESLSLEDMERDYIQRALRKYHGRRKEAAQELGISERTLYRKIKQYDIE